jgi:DNA-binding NarL/FixJ family response regulator
MESDPVEVKRAFGLGANGYVLKDADEEEVIEAIRQVAKGRHYVCPQLGARMVFFETERQRNAEIDPLSTREREVVKYVAMGYTNQEIAQRLFVSMRTVEAHRSRIMKKLKLTTRAELVNYATLHEII